MSTLYDLIIILPLSLLSVMLFGNYAGIPENSVFGYTVCVLFSVWLISLRNMKPKNRLRSVGIVLVFIAGLWLAAGEEYRLIFFEEYLWVVWIMCFSAGSLIAGMIMTRFIILKRLTAAALFIYCVTGIVLRWGISKAVFALICFIILIRIAEEIQLHWKKSGSPDIKEHITRLSPLFIALCMIVFLTPSPDKPYSWQLAKTIYHKVVFGINRLYGLITHPSDDYGNIGFSDNSGFLSGLDTNDEEVLNIYADTKRLGDIKLVGCISGEFEDRQWLFSTDRESCTRMIDTMETNAAIKKYAPDSRSDYLAVTELSYETLFYNTQYIFSPSKIRLVPPTNTKAQMTEKNGSVISSKKLHYKDKYYVSCFVLNYENPHLGEWLSAAEPITKSEWDQLAETEGVLDRQGYTYEDYLQYREDIYENFCRSYEVSDKVKEILSSIKNDSSSEYEEMKRLEYFLREFEYSTNCGALPDYVSDAGSFLDYFLFTSQKGYCMHFATSFVIMANAMGVPCRYVQGYNAGKDADGNIKVRQSDAHAWPEVYFDNVGWVAFEPTPGYSESTGWKIKDSDIYDPDRYKPSSSISVEHETSPEETELEEEKKKVISPLVFMIPTLAVVSFLLLFYIFSRSALKKKYKKMTGFDKLRHLTQQDLRFMGLLGFPMEEHETLTEFKNRLTASEREDLKGHIGFIPLYETVLYSDKAVSEEDIESAESIHHDLRELVKKSSLRYRLMIMMRINS